MPASNRHQDLAGGNDKRLLKILLKNWRLLGKRIPYQTFPDKHYLLQSL